MDQEARSAFLDKLFGLATTDCTRFVTEIPGASSHVNRSVPVFEQIAPLVEWAESTTGPGLDALAASYRTLFENPPTPRPLAVSAIDPTTGRGDFRWFAERLCVFPL